jgi:OHCU decarboxylase
MMSGGAAESTSPGTGISTILPIEPTLMNTRPSKMSRAAFIETFGDVYEHSPWLAARVFDAGLDARHDVPGHLYASFRKVIMESGKIAQMALLRAHPQLACGRRDLTDASQREQAGAGLDQCDEDEFRQFQALNKAYLTRYSFPFIVAVKGRSRAQILELFRDRVRREPDQEFSEALEQVCLIGKYRLAEKFRD